MGPRQELATGTLVGCTAKRGLTQAPHSWLDSRTTSRGTALHPASLLPPLRPMPVWLVALLLGTALVAGTGRVRAADADTPPDAASGPTPGEWLPRGGAELRLLDTQSAQASTLTLAVGQSRQVQSLTVTLRACLVRPPDHAADAAAQLDVTDAKGAGVPFHGWMFAAEPQLAMLENPGYSLLLVACK